MVRTMSEPTDETVGNDNEPEQREFERINGSKDNFAPPAEPCECWCLHCRRTFMSSEIWFQKVINARSGFDGFWMCPTPNCTGAGFTFDIFPTDPEHPANDGWSYDDDEEEEWDEEEMEETGAAADSEAWDPDESKYKELDEIVPEDDDISGEEWKYGLEPGACAAGGMEHVGGSTAGVGRGRAVVQSTRRAAAGAGLEQSGRERDVGRF